MVSDRQVKQLWRLAQNLSVEAAAAIRHGLENGAEMAVSQSGTAVC